MATEKCSDNEKRKAQEKEAHETKSKKEGNSEKKQRKAEKAAEKAARKKRKTEALVVVESDNCVNIEERLVIACSRAATAVGANPNLAELIVAHEEAQSALSTFRESKAGKKRKKPASSSVVAFEEGTELWTCVLCNATLTVRPDGRAKAQHLEGKSHAKKLRAAEGGGAGLAQTAVAASPAAGAIEECRLCNWRGTGADAAAHASGSKHRSRVDRLEKLWRAAGENGAQKGDWVCLAHAHANGILHNTAKATTCSACEGVREKGLGYEYVRSLLAQWKAAKVAQSRMTAVVATSNDRVLECRNCSSSITFTVREQKFYAEKAFAAPSSCASCRPRKEGKSKGKNDKHA